MPYYEQPGRTITVDKDGKTITTVTFVGDTEAPKPTGITGTLKNRSVTTDVAGQIRTTYQFENDGGSSGPLGKNVQLEIIAAVRTVPIEAHPKFGEKYLSAADKKKIKDAIDVPDRSPDFEDATNRSAAIALYTYLVSGVTSYYEPTVVVRKTYQAASPPPARKLGKIASPGVTVPGIPAGYNFLLVNVSSRGTTGAYTVTEEYEASGEGGWDKYLYT